MSKHRKNQLIREIAAGYVIHGEPGRVDFTDLFEEIKGDYPELADDSDTAAAAATVAIETLRSLEANLVK